MKKFLMLGIFGLSLIACSVESDELDLKGNEIQELNATIEVEGCTAETYDFGEAGIIEVINDDENLYISIVANEGYSLVNTRVHIADNLEDFPTTGNGDNLPPGQMTFHKPNPNADEHTFVLDLDDYPSSFLIASRSTFSKDGKSEDFWAGTSGGNKGKWSYFYYSVKECPAGCTEFLGPDNTDNQLTVVGTEGMTDIRGWTYEDFENYVYGTLLEGAPTGGSFEPTLESIFEELNDGTVPFGYYESTYTVTVNGCEDSIVIGATLICEVGCA